MPTPTFITKNNPDKRRKLCPLSPYAVDGTSLYVSFGSNKDLKRQHEQKYGDPNDTYCLCPNCRNDECNIFWLDRKTTAKKECTNCKRIHALGYAVAVRTFCQNFKGS